MRTPFIRRSREGRRDQRGITMALVAVAMVAIIGMAMMAIDLVTLFLAREEAQRAADAAALTAARIISVSGITGTASPSTQTADWALICGPSGLATQAAQAAGGQNSVGGAVPTAVNVTYGTSKATDCSTLTAPFAVNPLVTVQVQRTGLPTFFSRYWGYAGQSVSATATAEAFNPSASDVNNNGGTGGTVTPVQPRCVKPWIVPNQNPNFPTTTCVGIGCNQFVSILDGSIQNAGITTTSSPGGVIGETFTLFADCGTGTTCTPQPNIGTAPTANAIGATFVSGNAPPAPNLEYLPGEIEASAVAVPSCATSGSGGKPLYEPAVAGCDQSTQYQCGVPIAQGTPPNAIDLSENPGGGTGDTALGLACALTNESSVPLAGQDALLTNNYPFQIQAGSANPLKIVSGTQITTSNQIVSLPIYDSSATLNFGGGTTANVVIVGFLQVFITSIDASGNVSVTVLNVAGCGNGSTIPTNTPVTGSSPVPIRLITPP